MAGAGAVAVLGLLATDGWLLGVRAERMDQHAIETAAGRVMPVTLGAVDQALAQIHEDERRQRAEAEDAARVAAEKLASGTGGRPAMALVAPTAMPAGDSWKVPIPVPSAEVWHTADGPAPAGKKVVALTFDDGPSEDTAAVAQILLREKVPATFFVVGERIEAQPDALGLLKAFGFAIAAHSMTHPRLDKIAPAEMVDELVHSVDLANKVAGAGTVKCFRPPYGAWTLDVARTAAAKGVAVVNWTTDSTDYDRPGADTIVDRALTDLPDQAIVLLHDGPSRRGETVEALPRIISGLRDRGFEFTQIC